MTTRQESEIAARLAELSRAWRLAMWSDLEPPRRPAVRRWRDLSATAARLRADASADPSPGVARLVSADPSPGVARLVPVLDRWVAALEERVAIESTAPRFLIGAGRWELAGRRLAWGRRVIAEVVADAERLAPDAAS